MGLSFTCPRSAKMFSAQNKIHKDKGVAPTEFEETVAQVLVFAVLCSSSCVCFGFFFFLSLLIDYSVYCAGFL